MALNRSTADLERDLGTQLRQARLAVNIGQQELADRANISLGAVRNLEAGRGATLKTLISTVRALRLTHWLDELYPDPGPSPLEIAQARGMTQRRERATARPR